MTARESTGSLFGPETDPHPPCSRIMEVALDTGVDTLFSYLLPDDLGPVRPGQRVQVPLGRGNRPAQGFCVGLTPRQEDETESDELGFKLKVVSKILDEEPLVTPDLLDLARWISDYYVCPLGQVLAAMIPGAVKKGAGVKTLRYVYALPPQNLVEDLRPGKQRQVIEWLMAHGAVSKETAVVLQDVTEALDCTDQPIKSLAQKGLARITRRKALVALPALPEGLTLADPPNITLNEDQIQALKHIEEELESRHFGVTCLYGVTGSGKTEVYIRTMHHTLKQGRTAMVLLPEIALTTQAVHRFSKRFDNVALLHSGLSPAQRHAQWQEIRCGRTQVVVGARSAIFAPLENIGLIVVDEEHEPSYKQDTLPRYHGRDLAIKRAQLCQAHVILGSATPSLETLVNCRRRTNFKLVQLPKRVMDLPMPHIRPVDLREDPATQGGRALISTALESHLHGVLDRGEQAILLLNRRGYSNVVFCPACKHTLHCRNCDVTLTFHKSNLPGGASVSTVNGRHMALGTARCHYCLSETLVPRQCPLCHTKMAMIGLGSQRLEEEVATKFPQAVIARIDSDSMAGKDYVRVLQDFGAGRIQILAGTQMLAKGLHFPNVTCVGIISADTALFLPDFRANERTFQLISQVAGRAGRSHKEGVVFLQTFMPDQAAIQYALKNDFQGFIQEELEQRKACFLPPYWRLAVITLRDEQYERLEKAAAQLKHRVDMTVAAQGLQARVRGPVPAVISRIQRHHRVQIVVQTPEAASMQRLFSSLRAQPPIKPSVKTIIDIDPAHVL